MTTPKMQKLTSTLASLIHVGDELKDSCAKTYFGYLCVAFTTKNSLKHYAAFPWNFTIRDGDVWHHYYGLPNKVETRAKALRRAWHRAKWMRDGTYGDHYKANTTTIIVPALTGRGREGDT